MPCPYHAHGRALRPGASADKIRAKHAESRRLRTQWRACFAPAVRGAALPRRRARAVSRRGAGLLITNRCCRAPRVGNVDRQMRNGHGMPCPYACARCGPFVWALIRKRRTGAARRTPLLAQMRGSCARLRPYTIWRGMPRAATTRDMQRHVGEPGMLIGQSSAAGRGAPRSTVGAKHAGDRRSRNTCGGHASPVRDLVEVLEPPDTCAYREC